MTPLPRPTRLAVGPKGRPLLFTFVALCLALLAPTSEAQMPPSQGSAVAHQQFVFAYTMLQRAQKTNDQRDMKVASDAFDDFLGRFPEEDLLADALYYRALIAHLKKDERQAQWYLGRAQKMVMVADASVNLLRGQVAAALGQYRKAIALLVKIDTQHLDDVVAATVWLERARCYRQLGRLYGAAAALESAAAKPSPLQSRALLELATLQAELGRSEQAIKALQQCLSLKDPQVTPHAAWLAGDQYFKLHQFDKAIVQFQKVAQYYPGSYRFSRSVIDLMWSQLKLGQNYAVIETFKRYRELLAPDLRVGAWNLAASAHQRKGEHELAGALLESALASVRGSKVEDQMMYKLALSQFELEQYQAMMRTINRLRAAHPDSAYQPDAEFLLAKADMARNRTDEAAARLSAIIEVGPTHRYYAQAIHQRAWLYETRSRIGAAISDYWRLLDEQLIVQPAQAHTVALRLINLYISQGSFKQAADQANLMLGFDLPTTAGDIDPLVEQEALYRLGWALIKLGQFEKAHFALDRLLKRYPISRYRTQALYFDGLVLMNLDKPVDGTARMAEAIKSDDLELVQQLNALRLSAIHFRKTAKDDAAAAALVHLGELSQGKDLRLEEHLWVGRYLQEHDRPQQAIVYLRPLIGHNPNITSPMRSEALFLTARALRSNNDKSASITAYRQVIAMMGRYDLQARLEMAQTLQDNEQYSAAMAEFAGLINVRQTRTAALAMLHSAQVHRALARKRALAGDVDNQVQENELARRMLLRLTILHSKPQISPLPQLARLALAQVESDLGRADVAGQVYRELISQYADTPYSLYALAMLDLAAGQSTSAVARLRKLETQELDPILARRARAQLLALESAQ